MSDPQSDLDVANLWHDRARALQAEIASLRSGAPLPAMPVALAESLVSVHVHLTSMHGHPVPGGDRRNDNLPVCYDFGRAIAEIELALGLGGWARSTRTVGG
ncbi:MAG: hypothetical protein EPO40_16560 [Myxococcaceae bacterium]|nr:MAG: hypothetical protein EPO40_16560 [Myxococcaceae bacterium]